MSILGSILSKILGRPAAAAAPQAASVPAAAIAPLGSAPAASAAPPSAAPSSVPAATMAPVNVEAVMTDLATRAGQPLNWKTSIVDLMKLVGLDSSLTARKALAAELHFAGDMTDSAAMNIWLHQQVMQKLAANGGHLPADLKA